MTTEPSTRTRRERRHLQTPNVARVDAAQVSTAQEAAGQVQVAVRSNRAAIALRLVLLVVTVVALYILWPSLLTVFERWPELLDLNPAWFVVMLALEAMSFVCIWGLQRIALRTDRWFGVATAQLASNAFSRIVPGGAAAGGALQWRMLTDSGVDGARVATALTAASLISTGTLFMLPRADAAGRRCSAARYREGSRRPRGSAAVSSWSGSARLDAAHPRRRAADGRPGRAVAAQPRWNAGRRR